MQLIKKDKESSDINHTHTASTQVEQLSPIPDDNVAAFSFEDKLKPALEHVSEPEKKSNNIQPALPVIPEESTIIKDKCSDTFNSFIGDNIQKKKVSLKKKLSNKKTVKSKKRWIHLKYYA
jgi:hypothetical protein